MVQFKLFYLYLVYIPFCLTASGVHRDLLDVFEPHFHILKELSLKTNEQEEPRKIFITILSDIFTESPKQSNGSSLSHFKSFVSQDVEEIKMLEKLQSSIRGFCSLYKCKADQLSKNENKKLIETLKIFNQKSLSTLFSYIFNIHCTLNKILWDYVLSKEAFSKDFDENDVLHLNNYAEMIKTRLDGYCRSFFSEGSITPEQSKMGIFFQSIEDVVLYHSNSLDRAIQGLLKKYYTAFSVFSCQRSIKKNNSVLVEIFDEIEDEFSIETYLNFFEVVRRAMKYLKLNYGCTKSKGDRKLSKSEPDLLKRQKEEDHEDMGPKQERLPMIEEVTEEDIEESGTSNNEIKDATIQSIILECEEEEPIEAIKGITLSPENVDEGENLDGILETEHLEIHEIGQFNDNIIKSPLPPTVEPKVDDKYNENTSLESNDLYEKEQRENIQEKSTHSIIANEEENDTNAEKDNEVKPVEHKEIIGEEFPNYTNTVVRICKPEKSKMVSRILKGSLVILLCLQILPLSVFFLLKLR